MSKEKDTTHVSLSDFSSAVGCLEMSRANWVVFQNRFLIAVRQKKVLCQFDGTNPKPSLKAESTETEKKVFMKELAAWQDKEDLASYLMTQKLLDSIFTKYL
jgi:hypothetical protein